MRIDRVAPLLAELRKKKPLVHCITNDVTPAVMANVLLACGASPVMARDGAEVEEVVRRADALVVNLGTPDPTRIDAALKAVAVARDEDIPWVLDPVGVGASRLRRRAVAALLAEAPVVVRGNAAEIAFLAGEAAAAPGVDAPESAGQDAGAALALAQVQDCVVAMTGAQDHIAGQGRLLAVANGDPLMTRVTGLGCSTTALIAGFTAVADDAFAATAAAVTLMGLAGERAAATARGPGSLASLLLDALYSLHPDDLCRAARWSDVPSEKVAEAKT